MNKDLSIVIVTYNCADLIRDCLINLKNKLPDNSEVIVVDNNSSDDSADVVKKTYPAAKLFLQKQNLGFAKANNLAVEKSQGEYLLFLNPDTKVQDAGIAKLLTFIKSHPKAGIIAPKLVKDKGEIQPSVRKLPTVKGAFKEYILGIKNSYEAYAPKAGAPIKVECVVAAAILMKKELFEMIGGFDEKYFMYFEDIDLCRKVLKKGFDIYYIPEVSFYHKVGGTKESNINKLAWLKQSTREYHGLIRSYLLEFIFLKQRLFNKI